MKVVASRYPRALLRLADYSPHVASLSDHATLLVFLDTLVASDDVAVN